MRVRSARILQPGQKIRVLVVDDSVVIRRLVCHALGEDPGVDVVGVAANGRIALSRIPQLNPDVITLDIEMPEMDGLEMLRQLRRSDRSIPVVMFSTMTERGASATFEALSLGADDYVTKASNAGSLDVSLAHLRQELIPKIRQFFQVVQPQALPRESARLAPASTLARSQRRAVAIGVSTGGPAALARVIPQFPERFPLPIFIVQHMPPLFTRLLAERLDTLTPLAVEEGADGELATAGRIYLAPGDRHMRVVDSAYGPSIVLDQGPPLNSCRPAVDALFGSLAEVYGPAVVAAVLTGMGHDGLVGVQRLAARGACILAQDEESSVVWGMPGAVAGAGVAHQILPLDAIVPAILREVDCA
ncbi:MAG TPA: chemotaxis response regulator protein-glutamate methylesterase [Bryobacteraceae bacterium]|jgi:two-component system chemotaxis response regulator CheB|nr:chemotaxis response regulator protein-glutamate methylesterase [Bryobacteraceae bacterium]